MLEKHLENETIELVAAVRKQYHEKMGEELSLGRTAIAKRLVRSMLTAGVDGIVHKVVYDLTRATEEYS